MPMAKAIGTLRKASARKAANPRSASIPAVRDEVAARPPEREDRKRYGGESHEDAHRIGEPGELELQLRSGLARAVEGLGAQPEAPGEIAGTHEADRARDDMLDLKQQPVRRDRIEEIDDHMLIPQRHERQAREDEPGKQRLGELEPSQSGLLRK